MKKLSINLVKAVIFGSSCCTFSLFLSQPAYSFSPKCSTDPQTMTMARTYSKDLIRRVMSPITIKFHAPFFGGTIEAVDNKCLVPYVVKWKQYGIEMEAKATIITDSNGNPLDYSIETN